MRWTSYYGRIERVRESADSTSGLAVAGLALVSAIVLFNRWHWIRYLVRCNVAAPGYFRCTKMCIKCWLQVKFVQIRGHTYGGNWFTFHLTSRFSFSSWAAFRLRLWSRFSKLIRLTSLGSMPLAWSICCSKLIHVQYTRSNMIKTHLNSEIMHLIMHLNIT